MNKNRDNGGREWVILIGTWIPKKEIKEKECL